MNNTQKNARKINVNIGNKNEFAKQLLNFYNGNIRKKHIILSIILLVLFIAYFGIKFIQLKNGTYQNIMEVPVRGFFNMLGYEAILCLVIIGAGITPGFLSLLGLFQFVLVVEQLSQRYFIGKGLVFTDFLGGLIQMVGISLCVAVGLYLGRLSSKRNKYDSSSDYGFNDLKIAFYEAKKDEKKINEIKEKKNEKIKKNEVNNVKIPYFYILLLGFIAYVVEIFGTLIAFI